MPGYEWEAETSVFQWEHSRVRLIAPGLFFLKTRERGAMHTRKNKTRARSRDMLFKGRAAAINRPGICLERLRRDFVLLEICHCEG